MGESNEDNGESFPFIAKLLGQVIYLKTPVFIVGLLLVVYSYINGSNYQGYSIAEKSLQNGFPSKFHDQKDSVIEQYKLIRNQLADDSTFSQFVDVLERDAPSSFSVVTYEYVECRDGRQNGYDRAGLYDGNFSYFVRNDLDSITDMNIACSALHNKYIALTKYPRGRQTNGRILLAFLGQDSIVKRRMILGLLSLRHFDDSTGKGVTIYIGSEGGLERYLRSESNSADAPIMFGIAVHEDPVIENVDSPLINHISLGPCLSNVELVYHWKQTLAARVVEPLDQVYLEVFGGIHSSGHSVMTRSGIDAMSVVFPTSAWKKKLWMNTLRNMDSALKTNMMIYDYPHYGPLHYYISRDGLLKDAIWLIPTVMLTIAVPIFISVEQCIAIRFQIPSFNHAVVVFVMWTFFNIHSNAYMKTTFFLKSIGVIYVLSPSMRTACSEVSHVLAVVLPCAGIAFLINQPLLSVILAATSYLLSMYSFLMMNEHEERIAALVKAAIPSAILYFLTFHGDSVLSNVNMYALQCIGDPAMLLSTKVGLSLLVLCEHLICQILVGIGAKAINIAINMNSISKDK